MALSGSRLTRLTARVLRDVLVGFVDAAWEQRASNPERVALGRLTNAGLIRRDGERYLATDPVARTLLPAAPNQFHLSPRASGP